jgi:hypothetical protein
MRFSDFLYAEPLGQSAIQFGELTLAVGVP